MPLSLPRATSYKRVCIFVDGENFRYSLVDLFRDEKYDFDRHTYLPDADWASFFEYLVESAGKRGWELLRSYWYVTRDVYLSPAKLPRGLSECRDFLSLKRIPEQMARHGEEPLPIETQEDIKAIRDELDSRKRAVRSRQEGWRTVRTAIEHQNNQIEFRAVGSIRYNLCDEKYGTEKGVDTQMATDLITLADIYDVAIIVSGDADYIPPCQAIKRLGKLVYSVSFLTTSGEKLPGGARALERVVDGRLEIPFEESLSRLSIRETRR